jgi:hypothetical protein
MLCCLGLRTEAGWRNYFPIACRNCRVAVVDVYKSGSEELGGNGPGRSTSKARSSIVLIPLPSYRVLVLRLMVDVELQHPQSSFHHLVLRGWREMERWKSQPIGHWTCGTLNAAGLETCTRKPKTALFLRAMSFNGKCLSCDAFHIGLRLRNGCGVASKPDHPSSLA